MLRLGNRVNSLLVSSQRLAGRYDKHGSKRTRSVRRTEKNSKYWKMSSNKSGHEQERAESYVLGSTSSNQLRLVRGPYGCSGNFTCESQV